MLHFEYSGIKENIVYRLNRGYIIELAVNSGWSQNELARRMKLPKGTLSNALSGRRGAGRKVIVDCSGVSAGKLHRQGSISKAGGAACVQSMKTAG